MADHEEFVPREPRDPAELFRPTVSAGAADLAAALGGLDRATRNFSRRLGEDRPAPEHRPGGGPAGSQAAPGARFGVGADDRGRSGANGSPLPSSAPPLPRTSPSSPEAVFEQQMREAERHAREYLNGAKRRADSLVTAMVAAVEQEASAIRRDAEEGIRARWRQVEIDAGRHVENARRVAAQMVAERQERIASLSDGISGRADALTAGMEDADRVRGQFNAFVRALSMTADQIARSCPSDAAGELHELRKRPQPRAIAA